ncbi:hypothetical protein ACIPC1_04375 [Streptomyces sp. NPDC087263]|uniref:hypothetical protein n=1 Tax=Streptomyces sp. NPDC087263 TaxID=3365773 RepID=UPI0038042B7D
MNEELTVLAEASAAALVTAMATDVWQETRSAFVGLFHRSDRDRRAAVAAQLDGNAALVGESAAPDDVRRTLFDYWTMELAALLDRDPSCRDSLARLAAAADGALVDGLRAYVLVQTNTARDSATVFAVQRGTQHAHGRVSPS